MKYNLAVDVGGTSIRMAIVNQEGQIIKHIKDKTGKMDNEDDLINKIVDLYNQINEEKYEIKSMGIGVPGPVNSKDGFIYVLPNIGIENINIKKLLEEKLNINVYVGNDANLASLGEAKFGSGKEFKNVLYITVSTGIGGGYIVNNEIIDGFNGVALEIGNMIINPNGERQGKDTNYGSFESLCSGTYLVNEIIKNDLKVRPSELFSLDNEVAKNILDKWYKNMAIGIANLINILAPEVIVFGGGVGIYGDLFIPRLKEEVNNYIFSALKNKVEFKVALLQDNSGLLGASLIASM